MQTVSFDSSIRLYTEHLVLRATAPADVERAIEIRSNHEVARNLASATIPPDIAKMTNWFAGHAEEWRTGSAYRLAIILDGHLIGICDVFDVSERQGEIGYWLDEEVWGRGFGQGAAERLVRFAVGCRPDLFASWVCGRQRRFGGDPYAPQLHPPGGCSDFFEIQG
ncbi:GNAT family N-acetyltransferase [Rhizobium sp. BK376]|uniref:GNAT family N-acetyltransferase n=1 Tax=Rhizobium sp. BK376 TaxID=2512149 RepID=UPI0010D8B528|nr:GNAT family N-acetyltransferase [Rhizobium sp. BK376]TCR71483.1 acetyltransferase (GNAT) family protein [Rhizobium sp. BK376]